ncbi:hypothetical protein MKW94_016116 [Papaver nudicaule]|uniref:Helicase C-terminal domain-containing protein n=1 Tax=Papaver nudicaule TaxID=74823 RepID=A0AA41SDV0_PAPNU|nr:hypothetical protein [Papaver nudicaule]
MGKEEDKGSTPKLTREERFAKLELQLLDLETEEYKSLPPKEKIAELEFQIQILTELTELSKKNNSKTKTIKVVKESKEEEVAEEIEPEVAEDEQFVTSVNTAAGSDNSRTLSKKKYGENEDKKKSHSFIKKKTRIDASDLVHRKRNKSLEVDLDAIKVQNLGTAKKSKMRVIKPSEKFEFCFYSNGTNTSRVVNSLYENPHEAQLLFGRGFRASMDRREQKNLAAIPLGLQQRDVIGIAETGSDTVSIKEQGFKIRQGCEVVITTPGHLIDCLERRYAVLEEADWMIYMGFEPQAKGVLDAMPSSNLIREKEDEELDAKRIYRTPYMFSVTIPPGVERLARKYLRNLAVVSIGTAGKATELITHNVVMIRETKKNVRLQKLLNDLDNKTPIVFINTSKSVDYFSKTWDKRGYRVTALHGGKSREQREISLEEFRNKRFNVPFTTDVAGVGIDIPDVAPIINYDMPGNIEMHTPHIGRTGRAGKTGVFFLDKDELDWDTQMSGFASIDEVWYQVFYEDLTSFVFDRGKKKSNALWYCEHGGENLDEEVCCKILLCHWIEEV